ncbi:MAG: FHA domain-containing protein [Crocinitomicaceae bacterium]|nr:FHA domain-containing protein [Crocinitomicaceae bacterium]
MDKIHIRIGTAPDNQMVLESQGVDAYHLELFSDTDGNVFITDLNSVNGTFVNGKQLRGFMMLSEGDKVVLGHYFTFRWENFIQKPRSIIEEKTVTTAAQKPLQNKVIEKQNEKEQVTVPKNIDKQLVVIYSLIVLVLALLAFLF